MIEQEIYADNRHVFVEGEFAATHITERKPADLMEVNDVEQVPDIKFTWVFLANV